MKKWAYLILSVVGFAILFAVCERKIREAGIAKTDYKLLMDLYKFSLLWWGVALILPAAAALMLGINNVLILIYVYLVGCVVAGKLYKWKEKNIEGCEK